MPTAAATVVARLLAPRNRAPSPRRVLTAADARGSSTRARPTGRNRARRSPDFGDEQDSQAGGSMPPCNKVTGPPVSPPRMLDAGSLLTSQPPGRANGRSVASDPGIPHESRYGLVDRYRVLE